MRLNTRGAATCEPTRPGARPGACARRLGRGWMLRGLCCSPRAFPTPGAAAGRASQETSVPDGWTGHRPLGPVCPTCWRHRQPQVALPAQPGPRRPRPAGPHRGHRLCHQSQPHRAPVQDLRQLWLLLASGFPSAGLGSWQPLGAAAQSPLCPPLQGQQGRPVPSARQGMDGWMLGWGGTGRAQSSPEPSPGRAEPRSGCGKSHPGPNLCPSGRAGGAVEGQELSEGRSWHWHSRALGDAQDFEAFEAARLLSKEPAEDGPVSVGGHSVPRGYRVRTEMSTGAKTHGWGCCPCPAHRGHHRTGTDPRTRAQGWAGLAPLVWILRPLPPRPPRR